MPSPRPSAELVVLVAYLLAFLAALVVSCIADAGRALFP